MFCAKCGRECQPGDSFCPKCGGALSSAENPQKPSSDRDTSKPAGKFHRFCVGCLLLWTVWWAGLTLGVLTRAETGGSTGAMLGLTLGLGMYAFFWFLPSLVLGITAIATKPAAGVNWPKSTKIAMAALSALAFVWSFGAFRATGERSIPGATDKTNTDVPQGWTMNEDVSAMDGSKTIVLSLDAVGEIKGWLESTKPTLVIRCKEKKTNVYVNTGTRANVEYGMTDSAHVRVRFDDSESESEVWNESTDGKALFAANPVRFANRLNKAKIFRFEFTPYNASPAIAEFHVDRVQD